MSGVSSATGGESTLNLADVVDGGAGTDTLKLIVSGAVNMAASEIKNVENFEIKDLTGGNTHSFANVTGEAQVLVVSSTGATTVTNLDKAAVGVKDITGAAATQTFTFKDSAFASTGKLDVVVSNAGNKVTGAAQTITIGTASAGTGAADGVNIAATGSNNIILSGTAANNIGSAAGIKTLTVTGSGSVTVGATSALAAAAGAGASSLASNLTTVDASANTGGLTINLNKTTVKVTGGSGADKITVDGAMTSGAQFNLGAGDDQLLKGAGSLDANVVVDAGAGTDIIDNGLITVANGGIFKNFEKIGLSTAGTTDIDLLTGSTITGLVVNTADVVGVTVQNVATNSTIEVTAVDASQTGTLTAAVKGAAASTTDVMNISFNGAAQAATPAAYNIAGGTMTLANVETINVASGGADNTWNQLALTADKVKAINITGAKNLDLTFAGTNGTNPVAGQGGAVSSIDGSAATGKLKIDLTSVTYDDKVGITVKGGTGNDTITTNASSATLTGTGGNDKYVVSATIAASAVDATTAATKMTTITDFNAGDMLDFTGFAAGAGVTSLTKAQTDIATATNLTNAINLALENAAVNAAGKAAWFQYGGNTYVVNQGAADTAGAANDFTAADAIVKLTGLVDLTNATVSGNVLTLA